MFTVFQIPITDSRSFLPDGPSRLVKPAWPIPEAEKDFLRQFGAVHKRRRGGLHEFAGEDVFCRASNAIRIRNETGIISGGDGSQLDHQRCIFRRFFFEGRSVGKMEIGLRRLDEPFRARSHWALLIHTISKSQWIVGPYHPQFALASPLIASGDAIAKLYLRSTTAKATPASNAYDWCVSAGEPVLVIEFRADDFPSPPAWAVRVPLSTHSVDLHYQHLIVGGRKLNVWYLGFRDIDKGRLRHLRMHLLRFHAELQSLKTVLRTVVDNRFAVIRATPSCDELQEFLRDAFKLISKDERYGVDQKTLRTATGAFFAFVSAGERESLLFKLRQIRKNILRLVEAKTIVGPDSFHQITVIGDAHFLSASEIKTQGDTMTNVNIKFGDCATVHGDLIVAQSIQNSFNTLQESTVKDTLKAKLEELTKEIAQQSQSLPEGDARQLAEDLNVLVKESVKQSPRRKWYELSAEGVMDAAKAFGAASGRIIGLVKDVLSLLTGT